MDRAHRLLIDNVERLLEERQWSKRQLAKEMAMAPGQLSDYLLGHKEPGIAVISRLAEAFGTTPAKLLAGPDERPNLLDALTLAGRFLQDFGAKGFESPMLRELAGLPPHKKE